MDNIRTFYLLDTKYCRKNDKDYFIINILIRNNYKGYNSYFVNSVFITKEKFEYITNTYNFLDEISSEYIDCIFISKAVGYKLNIKI